MTFAGAGRYYLLSAPAHMTYPSRLVRIAEAARVELGARETSNERVIHQFVHPDVMPSCQLVVGMTKLATGSVWNTMPAHVHDRRMEAYLYIDLDPAARVFHMMGEPSEIRPLVIALGIVLAIVTLEVGLRILRTHSSRLNALLYSPTVRTHFDGIATTPELLATSTFGYHPLGHTPGFVLNSRGFRTDEYTEKKPAGVYRVIALGDSFTFDSYGVPIEQMWHQVLERELSARYAELILRRRFDEAKGVFEHRRDLRNAIRRAEECQGDDGIVVRLPRQLQVEEDLARAA